MREPDEEVIFAFPIENTGKGILVSVPKLSLAFLKAMFRKFVDGNVPPGEFCSFQSQTVANQTIPKCIVEKEHMM